ncbi:MAG: envelope biogenesis factor ElyC [Gammaproteobacteria bacterium]|nr:envelope biogenesis factor ElyC [Gammaproteobacteria bacterium]
MFLAKKILGSLLQPLPLSLIVAAFGVYLLWRGRQQTLGKLMIGLALVMVYGFSTPFIGNGLIKSLEQQYPAIIETSQYQSIEFIVVLGGGHKVTAWTPVSSHLSGAALKRVTEGLRLQKELSNAQLIFSGGAVFSEYSEANTMARIANAITQTPGEFIVENQTRDTASQAKAIAQLVDDKPFLLVTSAAHMPRSMWLMQQHGLKPIAAPTDFQAYTTHYWNNPTRLFPGSHYLKKSESAIHEYLGQWWAKLTH